MSASVLPTGEFLKGATIEYGSIRPDNGGFVHLFAVNTSTESYWFTVKLEFAENGNDFAMLIRSFGSLGRMSTKYKSFNASEIEEIKIFLETYFSSRDIPDFSTMTKGRRPFALHYTDNWIIEGNGELYQDDGLELRRMESVTPRDKAH